MEENENLVPIPVEEKTEFKCKGFKTEALRNLTGKWKPITLITLFIAAITLCFSMLSLFFSFKIATVLQNIADPGEIVLKMWVTTLIIGLVYSTLIAIMSLAYIMLYPGIKNGIQPTFSRFFSGFSYWYKGIGSFWWIILWLFLWMLAGGVPGLVVTIILVFTAEDPLLFAKIGVPVIYIGMLTAGIIKNYQYSQHYFVIADDPSVKVTQALNISKKITKGFKWKLFVLDLSFIGWYFLFAIVWFCCFMIVRKSTAAIIGAISILSLVFSLFFFPYYMASKFNAFKWLMKRNEEKQSVLIEQKPGV